LVHHERVLGALGIFALLVGLVIFMFMCYQLHLVYSGTTANESVKREDLEDIIIAGELWVFDKEELKKHKKKNKVKDVPKVKATAVYWVQPARRRQNRSSEGEVEGEGEGEGEVNSGENSKQIGRQVKSISEISNLYDQGLWSNFKEVLFPPSL